MLVGFVVFIGRAGVQKDIKSAKSKNPAAVNLNPRAPPEEQNDAREPSGTRIRAPRSIGVHLVRVRRVRSSPRAVVDR